MVKFKQNIKLNSKFCRILKVNTQIVSRNIHYSEHSSILFALFSLATGD